MQQLLAFFCATCLHLVPVFSLISRLRTRRLGALARNGSRLLGWMLLRAVAQAGIVILLARQLGAVPYGQFVAAIAVASFFIPFIGLGLSHIVLRNAARDPSNEAAYFTRALRWWVISLLPGSVLAFGVAALLLPHGIPLVATSIVIAAELLSSSLTELYARHQQAQQNTHAYGAINAGLPLFRLIGFGLLFFVLPHTDVATVLGVYAASSLCYAALLWWKLPKKKCGTDALLTEPMSATSGLPFSLAAFAMKLQGEFNKPVLAQSSLGFAGSYNVAQRAVDFASMPLLALQEALWPRLYAQAQPLRQLRHSGLALLALALALGTAIWLAAPLLPRILGPSFADSVAVLRLLAWLPLLQTLRYLINFYAIHRTWMSLIGWVYTVGAVVNVALIAALVPRWNMTGAVAAAYLTELAMTATLFISCLSKYHHARQHS